MIRTTLHILIALLRVVIFALVCIGGIAVLGTILDGLARHSQERDACLRGAGNGLEIERCKR